MKAKLWVTVLALSASAFGRLDAAPVDKVVDQDQAATDKLALPDSAKPLKPAAASSLGKASPASAETTKQDGPRKSATDANHDSPSRGVDLEEAPPNRAKNKNGRPNSGFLKKPAPTAKLPTPGLPKASPGPSIHPRPGNSPAGMTPPRGLMATKPLPHPPIVAPRTKQASALAPGALGGPKTSVHSAPSNPAVLSGSSFVQAKRIPMLGGPPPVRRVP